MRFCRVGLVALMLSLSVAASAVAGGRQGSSGLRGVRSRMRVQPAPSNHGPADPEVQKGLSAYGAGRYAEARRIAEGLLKKPNRGSTHSEALDMLVLSWLAQGNFAEARAAAKQYSAEMPAQSKERLAQVDRDEHDYQSQLKRRQAEKAKAKKPEQAAQAELMIGHVHHQYGRMDLAEAAYKQVVTKYPKTKAAARAQRQLDSMHGKTRHALNPKGARKAKAAPKAKQRK